jgi:hypothetical protein
MLEPVDRPYRSRKVPCETAALTKNSDKHPAGPAAVQESAKGIGRPFMVGNGASCQRIIRHARTTENRGRRRIHPVMMMLTKDKRAAATAFSRSCHNIRGSEVRPVVGNTSLAPTRISSEFGYASDRNVRKPKGKTERPSHSSRSAILK